jgi:hypothetical protein
LLNPGRWLAEHHNVFELLGTKRKLQWIRHARFIRMSEASEAEKSLDHVHESLTWRDFDSYTNIAVSCIPPVVPDSGFDD